jgi:hypothetical protein
LEGHRHNLPFSYHDNYNYHNYYYDYHNYFGWSIVCFNGRE